MATASCTLLTAHRSVEAAVQDVVLFDRGAPRVMNVALQPCLRSLSLHPYEGDVPPPFPTLETLFEHLGLKQYAKRLEKAYNTKVGDLFTVYCFYLFTVNMCSTYTCWLQYHAHTHVPCVLVLQREFEIGKAVQSAAAAVRATELRAQEHAAAAAQLGHAPGSGALSWVSCWGLGIVLGC